MIVGCNYSYGVPGGFPITRKYASDVKDGLGAARFSSSHNEKPGNYISGNTNSSNVEKTIKSRESLLRNVLEATDDGIAFFDINGTIRLSNKRFREIWNIPNEAEIGKNYLEAFTKYGVPQLKNASEVLSKIQNLSGPQGSDSDLLYFRDGRIFEYYLFPVITDGILKGYVCSYRDITMRKNAESALQEYARELEHSNELKDLFKTGSDYTGILSDIVKKQIGDRGIPALENFNGIKPDQDFYIADKCLVIYFQLYELAAYVFGILCFPVPVYILRDIVDENGPMGRMLYGF